MTNPRLNDERTEALVAWCHDANAGAPSSAEAARLIARRLGAHFVDGLWEFGFWLPELVEARVPEGDVFLEILDPREGLDLGVARHTARFTRTRLPIRREGTFAFAAVEGLRSGTRDQIGHFYAVHWRDGKGEWHRILDPLAASLPYGAFAPAEIYDLDLLQKNRTDCDYYDGLKTEGVVKMPVPRTILQLHVPSATAGGTLASLARQYEHIAVKLNRGETLEPAEQLFVGYDAVQLLPVEPTTVYEAGPAFWEEASTDEEDVVEVTLRRPDTTNWGYDVVIAGSAAVNPTLLESGRPDELVDLAAILHTFPGRPIKLIFDVVYGHADNQALDVLNYHYFAGPNMYGQDLNYRNAMVRAILLEMQRRKVNFGADGVRVDGAQDFKWWDADAQQLRHDDDYLQAMADVEQDVCGCRYRPWFVFEDGRPWPQEDWELASTYRSVIERQNDPDVFQWGPLTFAHNTPFLYTFWLAKWWRIQEIVRVGANWISGCANHDTLRRGTQINPKLNINTRLGESRMEILDKAYDNPAVQMLTYAAFPGVPMDFLNASARASWGFIRNQDHRWAVKVVAEEVISLQWQIDDKTYAKPLNFVRLKEMGFEDRESMARFMEFLPGLVEVTGYDLDAIVALLQRVEPPLAGPEEISVPVLHEIARAWMDDMHDYCNVSRYHELLSPSQVAFNLSLRRFRDERPWLRDNLGPDDFFDRRRPVEGSVLVMSLRNGPDGEQVLLVCNMEGRPVGDFDPVRLEDIPGLDPEGWSLALRTPPIGGDYIGGPLTLQDSTGVVFTRKAA